MLTGRGGEGLSARLGKTYSLAGDALATFPADEIVVAVEPDSYDIVDKALATNDSAACIRMIESVPLRVVTLAGRTAR